MLVDAAGGLRRKELYIVSDRRWWREWSETKEYPIFVTCLPVETSELHLRSATHRVGAVVRQHG